VRYAALAGAAVLRARLRHVYWIGGGSGAGKSTIARRIFGMIVEDLLRLPREPCVIIEGFRLLPRLVQPLLVVPGHAVWLLPTPGFRRAAMEGRGSLREIAQKTSDPDKALRNLLERDRMFTERLQHETKRLGRRVIEVNTTMTDDDLAGRVTKAFGL
jgi:hypothetical protein